VRSVLAARPAAARRAGRAAAALAALAGAGCAGPGWNLATNEPAAGLYLDGRLVGHGSAAVPYRYYGVSSLTVVPAGRAARTDVRAPVRALIHLEPPAPRWLFPADLLLEALRRGFAPAPAAEATLPLPEPEATLAPGVRPASAADLKTRARQVASQR